MTLQKQILAANPKNLPAGSNYALASKKLGGLLWKMNRMQEAMEYYQTALGLEEAWSAREPSNTDAKMAVSFSHSDIGFLLNAQQKPREALEHYRTTVKIREEMAAADPNNARATLSLVSAYWRTASVSVAAGDSQTASDLLAKAVKTVAQSRNPAPGSVRSRSELAHIYSIYGESYTATSGQAAGRAWYLRARQVLTDLRGSGELDANGTDLLRAVEEQLAGSGKTR